MVGKISRQAFARITELKQQLESDRTRPVLEFDSIAEFEQQLYGLLSSWLARLVPAAEAAIT